MTTRIMLYIDEMIIARDIQQRLESMGYEVVAQASSTEEAVQFARKYLPHLILMDGHNHGPRDNGNSAPSNRGSQNIPVIYLTDPADDNPVNPALATDGAGYLVEPFDDRELGQVIENTLYKHNLETKLRESEERYTLATQAVNDVIWDWNLRSGEFYFSPRWNVILGLPETQTISSPTDWMERVHPEDAARLNLAISDHLQGYSPKLECEYRVRHQDGSYRWMVCYGLALFDAQNKPTRIAGSQADITAQKEIEDKLTQRALHDDLTQLPNRALFLERLKGVIEHTRSLKEKSAAVLFLDIDHFKLVNDSLGSHERGRVVMRFCSTARTVHSPGRYGRTLWRGRICDPAQPHPT